MCFKCPWRKTEPIKYWQIYITLPISALYKINDFALKHKSILISTLVTIKYALTTN